MELSDLYSVSKALHLIGMVSWMAGLFYLVRLMVNHAEAFDREEPEQSVLSRQYTLMEWKAYKIIIQPALVITLTFGTLLLIIQPVWLQQAWMLVKLVAVLFLAGYTLYCKAHIRRLENRSGYFSHVYYRALNEVPTLVLVAAVFLAVFRTGINWWYLTAGMIVFSGLILYAVRKVARREAEKRQRG